MAHRSLLYFRLFIITLFTFNLLNPAKADPAENALSKWGVKPKDSNSIAIDSVSRLQPMTKKYAYWLAVKYIPDFFDDKTIKDFVIKEFKDTRHYYYKLGGVGSSKPWLPEADVRDRNPELAAPEFMGRYRQTIHQFSGELSDRVRLVIYLGQPKYNAAKGVMGFDNTAGGKTNFAAQSYIKDPNDYSFLVRNFGREEADRFANQLAGRRIGEGANMRDGNAQPRLEPGTRIPAIVRVVPRYVRLFLALDRDLTIDGIPMSQREAEKFLNKYQRASGTTAAMVEVDVVVKGAVRLPAKGGASAIGQHYVTLIADVKSVTLSSPAEFVNDTRKGKRLIKREVLARYKADDFTPPARPLDVQRVQLAKGKQDARKKALMAQQAQEQEVAGLTGECQASHDPECWGRLCKKIKQMNNREKLMWCVNEQKRAMMAQARNVMGGGFSKKPVAKASPVAPAPVKKIQQDASKLRRQTQCRYIFRAPVAKTWFPTPGSQAYQSEMARCMKENGRNRYGPDVLGLRLGMSENEARSVMQRQHFSSRASTDDPRPFHDASLQWTRDDTHGIALYYLYSGGEKRVAAVSRRLYFDEKNTSVDQVRDGLRKKYGKESWISSSGTLLWLGNEKSGTRSCKRLAKQLTERTDWSRKWKAPRVQGSQSTSTGSAQSVSQACMNKYGFTPGMAPGPGSFDMSKMVALQQCMRQQAGKMVPGSSGRKQRTTMMIAKEGAPRDYKKFVSCGPVVVANQNSDTSGKLTDVSLVLFDPAWLAEFPGYLFKQGGNTGDIQF